MLTENELLAQTDSDYMNAEQQAFFKKLLEEKTQRVQQRLMENQEACRIERQPDDTDFATTEEQRSMALSMIDRDRVELKRINNALEIIESGDYGFCLETGDPIGIKRLLLVPESLYSVETMRIREAKDVHQAKVS